MNHMFWPTALVAVLLFYIGGAIEHRLTSHSTRTAFLFLALLAAIPGFLFAFYYTKLLGEPMWFYKFRAARFTEITAAGSGLIAGYIHELRPKFPLLRRQLRRFTVPILLGIMLAAPYLKPLVRPVWNDQLQEHWQGAVCMQSTPSTCGPASAVTILRMLGKEATEQELARESLTYRGGTENWYLVRALRKRGLEVSYLEAQPADANLPTPSIAGVKLQHGTGHFIALLDRQGTTYSVGDPLTGEATLSIEELRTRYTFTGFFLHIQ